MKYEQHYKRLLASNNAANNLLVLNLLQGQENWSKSKALTWILNLFITDLQELQQERFLYFGSTGLSFIFHHTILTDFPPLAVSNDTTPSLYKAILICRMHSQKQSKILYKIDYIEDISNLLDKYKQHLLEHLELIIRNFVTELK